MKFIKSLLLFFLLMPVMTSAKSSYTQVEKRSVMITNSIVALVSDDFASSGRYTISGGAELKINHLPVSYDFKAFYKDLNFYINGAIGFAELKEDTSYSSYDAKMQIYKIGGGVRYKPNDDFYIAVGYSLIHSIYDPNASGFTDDKLNEIFSQRQENWTDEYIIKIKYQHNVFGFYPYAKFEYEWYNTRSYLGSDDTKVKSEDSAFRTKLGIVSPTIFNIYSNEVKLNTFAGKTYFYGDIVVITDEKDYNTYGFSLDSYINDKDSLFKKVGIVSEWTDGNNFQGYNIGLTFELQF